MLTKWKQDICSKTKIKIIQEYLVTNGDIYVLDFVDMIKKLNNLPLTNIKHDIFSVDYKNGKCDIQPFGINTLSNLPKDIFSPSSYTGLEDRRHVGGRLRIRYIEYQMTRGIEIYYCCRRLLWRLFMEQKHCYCRYYR